MLKNTLRIATISWLSVFVFMAHGAYIAVRFTPDVILALQVPKTLARSFCKKINLASKENMKYTVTQDDHLHVTLNYWEPKTQPGISQIKRNLEQIDPQNIPQSLKIKRFEVWPIAQNTELAIVAVLHDNTQRELKIIASKIDQSRMNTTMHITLAKLFKKNKANNPFTLDEINWVNEQFSMFCPSNSTQINQIKNTTYSISINNIVLQSI